MGIITMESDTVKTIKTLNNIAKKGLNVFSDNYEINNESDNPDAIVVRSYNMHDMAFGDQLKAIGRAGAGVNNIPVDKCTQDGIVVFNTPGANANAVKELVLSSLINASRNLYEGVAWAQTLKDTDGDLSKLVEKGKKQFAGKEISGKTLGVIGLGAIGALVANSALNLDMDVIGFDPFISIDTAWKLSRNIQRAMTIEQLFAKADYITVHVPLSADTKGLFKKEAFDIMKSGVYILNFSRGELTNETDLAEALESGKVGKYITDFPNEKVLQMKNVYPTPHLGASTVEAEENCAVMAARQIKDYLETGNIKNSVNFPNVSLPYSGKCRIAAFHKNIPNTMGRMTSLISKYDLNIEDMANRSRGDYAYTIIDIDTTINESTVSELKENIEQMEGVIFVRMI